MLRLIDAGALATIQDHGRYGFQGYGIPVSGAMDIFSFSAANAVVRNRLDAASIEIHSPMLLETDASAIVALTGPQASFAINGRAVPQWMSIFVRAGSQIEIIPARAGGWLYLAIHGGIDAPLVLGSRSTYLRGQFGGWLGRALESGDEIPIGPQANSDYSMLAGKTVSARARTFMNSSGGSNQRITMRVISGPHKEWFTPEVSESIEREEYLVTGSADRMGYRMQGAGLIRRLAGELVSCGVPLGAIQVPADGQPIVLMADHQTTGGYPIIATLIAADIPRFAQCVEGDAIRFRLVDLEDAGRAWREMWGLLQDQD